MMNEAMKAASSVVDEVLVGVGVVMGAGVALNKRKMVVKIDIVWW
jgi:hypothetical protein